MQQETQTNEQLLASLKSTAEELVARLSNYRYMLLDDESADEGIALAGKSQRILYDAFVRAGMTKAELERLAL